MKYLIHKHGIDAPDYFPGVSTVYTQWSEVATGSGETETEAYEEAVLQIYEQHDEADELRLPKRPAGIYSKPTAPEDMYFYISIFYNL